MTTGIKLLFIGLLCVITNFLFVQKGYTENKQSEVTVTAELPMFISVDQLYIETFFGCWRPAFNQDKPFLNILDYEKISPETSKIRLSGLKYKVVSNTSTPLTITADFESLGNVDYNFAKSKLIVDPSSINYIPSESHFTPRFNPYVSLDSATPGGLYEGTILFTISE